MQPSDNCPPIGKFMLTQSAGFVCKSGINGWETETGNQSAGNSYPIDPAELGIPSNMAVSLVIYPVLADVSYVAAGESFFYIQGNPGVALYTASGTVFGANLTYNGYMSGNQNPIVAPVGPTHNTGPAIPPAQ